MLVPPIEASTLLSGRDVSPLGRGAITTTMLRETMPRKKMSRYFFTASLFFRNKANMIAPTIWPKPLHYRRDASIAARLGFSPGARHKSEKRRERGHPARCEAVKKSAPLQRFFSQLHSGRDPDESGRARCPRSVPGIGFHFYVAHPCSGEFTSPNGGVKPPSTSN